MSEGNVSRETPETPEKRKPGRPKKVADNTLKPEDLGAVGDDQNQESLDSYVRRTFEDQATRIEELATQLEEVQEALFNLNAEPEPRATVIPEGLEAKLQGLANVVVRMAHNTGTAHGLLKQNGLEPYCPNKKDMSKFSG